MAQWKYQAELYEGLLEGTGLEIRTHPLKGKGLFAQKAFHQGDIVLEETALCCSQNLDDAVRGIPVCAHCLKSLETPRRIVARLARSKQAALHLPFPSAAGLNRPVRCRIEDRGCHVVFCSARCREAAWRTHHAVMCRGTMTETQRSAYDAFLHFEWVQNGVDYSDTAYLALRMVAQAACAHRMHGKSVEASFAPFLQLVSAPITAFYFPYLLEASASDNDGENNGADGDAQKGAYEAFLTLKKNPMASPAVKESYSAGRTKDTFCEETVKLVHSILALDTGGEADFVSACVWSRLLGAVLLNGQERSPPSSYDLVSRTVHVMGVKKTLDTFEGALARDYQVNLDDLYYSTRGQGIYLIGCLFNHACDPNVEVVYSSADDETLTAIATRDINPDEELCISYVGTSVPFAQRQQQLYEHYLFECGCPLCEQEAKELETS